MGDIPRGNRPLSPHLQVYRLPISAVTSTEPPRMYRRRSMRLRAFCRARCRIRPSTPK